MDKELERIVKSDKFVEEVKHSLDYVSGHKQQAMRYGAIGLGVVAIALGWYFYSGYMHNVRQEALRDAMASFDAAILAPGVTAPEGVKGFASQAEKDKAVDKAFTDLATKYSGSDEGAIGHYFLAVVAADKGNLDKAAQEFQKVVDAGEKGYASLARLALGQIFTSQGKLAEAEKVLKYNVEHPTSLVSKEQATIELARVTGKRDPVAARKMLEPLRLERTAISQAAVQSLSQLPQN